MPLTLAIALGWRAQGLAAVVRQLAIAAAASAATFFALSPFLLVEPMTAWRDITANRQIVVDRAVATGAFAPAARYAEMLWTDAAGVPIAVLAIIGCVAALRSMPARAVFLLAFPLPFLLFISNTAPASRYLNPVLPFMALFAAVGVSALASRVSARAPVFWTIAALAAAPALWASVAADVFIRRDDTRTLAQRFVEANVPAGASDPDSALLGGADAVARGTGGSLDREPRRRRGGVDQVPAPARPSIPTRRRRTGSSTSAVAGSTPRRSTSIRRRFPERTGWPRCAGSE